MLFKDKKLNALILAVVILGPVSRLRTGINVLPF